MTQSAGMRSVVFTGANGFVGRTVLPAVCAAYPDADIVSLVHHPSDPGPDAAIRAAAVRQAEALGVRIVRGDLATGEGLDGLPRSPDLVVHLASSANTAASDYRVDDVGTRSLIEALGLGPASRVVFTSTVAIADGRADIYQPASPQREPGPALSAYGRHKRAAEDTLIDAANQSGFSLSIVRLCVVHATGSRPDGFVQRIGRTGIAPRFARRVIGAVGRGGAISTVHVDDVADIVLEHAAAAEPLLIDYAVTETLSLGEAAGRPNRRPGPHKPRTAAVLRWGTAHVPLRPLQNVCWQGFAMTSAVLTCESVTPRLARPGRRWTDTMAAFNARLAGEPTPSASARPG